MPNKKDALNYSALGIQMALTIGLGAWGGQYLDKKFSADFPVWTIVLILLGIAIALYQVIREVMNISKDEDTASTKKSKDEKS